jgi:heptosyltransferase III
VSKETILIFRLGSLGDTIVVLPCFHAIARRFPDARKVVLTNAPVSIKAPRIASILGPSGLVDDFIEFRSPVGFADGVRLARTIANLGASTLVFLAARPRRLSYLRDLAFFRACGLQKIIGGAPTRRLTPNVDPATGEVEPEAEFMARTLAELGRIDLRDRANWDLRLTPREIAAGEAAVAPLKGSAYLAVNAGGKVARKDWGRENWRRLLCELTVRRPDLGLLLVGSGDERETHDAIAQDWRGPVVNSAGNLSPRETAAAVSRAKAFIGHDSGPLHLASAVGVACVGLFGDYNKPRRWHPYGAHHRILHSMAGIRHLDLQSVMTATLQALAK